MIFRDWLSQFRIIDSRPRKRSLRRKKQARLWTKAEGLQPRMMLTDPLASISDGFVTEGDGTVSVDVTLDAPASTQITVDYSTSDGSATSPDDFAAAFGSLIFNSGDVVQTITVSIVDDSDVEPADESFQIDLTAAVGASIDDGHAEITVSDNDVTSPAGSTLSGSGTGTGSSTGTGSWTISTSSTGTTNDSGAGSSTGSGSTVDVIDLWHDEWYVNRHDIGNEHRNINRHDIGNEHRNINRHDIGNVIRHEHRDINRHDVGYVIRHEHGDVDQHDVGHEHRDVNRYDVGHEHRDVNRYDVGHEHRDVNRHDVGYEHGHRDGNGHRDGYRLLCLGGLDCDK